MGPDPFNMPTFGSEHGAGAELQGAINTLAPLATQYSGAQNGVNIAQYTAQPKTGSESGLSKFAHFIGGVGSEIGHIASGVTKWLGTQVVQGVEAPYKFGEAIAHGWLDKTDLTQINSNSTQLTDRMNTLAAQYKAGMISSKDYQSGLRDINQGFTDLVGQNTSLDNRIKADQNQAIKQGINTASDLVTVLTAGFGKAGATASLSGEGLTPVEAKTAADYLSSTSANAFLSNVETGINKLATDPELFAKLTPAAQNVIQKGVAEVVSQSGAMTAGQIARASAVNLALKYPLYYNMLSSTGNQLYDQLDQAKYGAAVRTLAFNAALLLSGGPIGKAMEALGTGASAVKTALFGESSFIDELSKGIGNGTASGLYDAIAKLAPEEQADVVKQLSAVEATNMSAVGHDPVAAAWRVLDGMSSYEGASMSTFSHEEALNNMVNFAKAQRLVDETAKTLDLGPVTAGRFDARAKGEIASFVTNGADSSQWLKNWESLKASSPMQAWANNENLDKQIKYILSNNPSTEEAAKAINGINAAPTVEGFPKDVTDKLGKMGYTVIAPRKLEAPFVEGTGKLVSKFAESNDFFTHAVQPLPVLSSVADVLTGVGMSPEASSQKVYEVFNKNVAENLSSVNSFTTIKGRLEAKLAAKEVKTSVSAEGGFSKDELALMQKQGITPELLSKSKVVGGEQTSLLPEVAKKAEEVTPTITDQKTTDYMIKKLSDYARNLPGRKLPITDLRQMTTSDVMKALQVSATEARETKSAIMDAMLKVPLEIRGLGDRIMDLNYKLNPLSRTYAKLQGAFRFAWNPFFQAKLATKTEFLTALEGGGYIPSVFAGEYSKLDSTVKSLRDGGFLEKRASFGALGGGESVAEEGVAGANLTHKVLGVQEKSIAGLVVTQANKAGMDVESFLKANPQQVRDTIQAIIGYDRNASFLNSPMAKTLNLAFFPFRFELKVSQFMARALAQTTPMTQVAVIKGLYNGSNWLKSSEGQAWYSQNAEVIGLFKYFSPVATMANISQALTGLGHESLSQTIGGFGELGGLPFGWIPQLLDAEGLTHFGQSYVNPKTGAVALDYVPASSRGQLQTAISDLMGSLYTYPGATVGLPSKGTIDRWAAAAITGGKSKSDFTTSTPGLSPQQQSFQQTVQQLAGNKPNNPLPVPAPTQPIKVPAEPSPVLTPLQKSGSVGTRKRKSQFTPQLLPGQAALGQLP